MLNKFLRKLLLLAAVLGLAAGGFSVSVHAQEINAYIGNTNSATGPWSLRSSTHWGGSFEFPIWYDISFEQRVGYLVNFPETTSVNSKTGSLLFNSNFNYHLPMRFFGLVPYVTMGVGFTHAIRNDPNHLGTNPDFNYGGGLKYLIPATPFGLRFDVRGHVFRNVINKDNINTIEYTLGVLYRMNPG